MPYTVQVYVHTIASRRRPSASKSKRPQQSLQGIALLPQGEDDPGLAWPLRQTLVTHLLILCAGIAAGVDDCLLPRKVNLGSGDPYMALRENAGHAMQAEPRASDPRHEGKGPHSDEP